MVHKCDCVLCCGNSCPNQIAEATWREQHEKVFAFLESLFKSFSFQEQPSIKKLCLR